MDPLQMTAQVATKQKRRSKTERKLRKVKSPLRKMIKRRISKETIKEKRKVTTVVIVIQIRMMKLIHLRP